MHCFSTVSELRQYYKDNEVSTKEFNPGGINFTSNGNVAPPITLITIFLF